jgi:pyruvate formate lyase activating enzyme
VAGYTRLIHGTGGGLTVSGGEPLLQPGFTEQLLRRSKEAGLHTALDTSGAFGDRASDGLLDHTDLVLLDLKSGDRDTYQRVTGGSLAPALRFAHRLAGRGIPMWIRFVLVPGLTDAAANVDAAARHAAALATVQRVEVVPFRRLDPLRYTELGLRFPLAGTEPPSPELLARVRAQFRSYGLTVH